MLPYSAVDAINSMTSAYGLALDPLGEHPRPASRITRWLRSLVHFA